MLGLGRASEYAGWWNTGLKTIRFTGSGALVPTVQQSPQFSWSYEINSGQTDQLTSVGTNIYSGTPVTGGNIDLTGLTTFTGYNTSRATVVHTFNLPWASGLTANGGQMNSVNLLVSGGSFDYGQSVGIDSSGQLYFYRLAVSGQYITLPGSYTAYTNTWLTLVTSQAETSSVFTNWTGGSQGSSVFAYRMALYNTQTGVLIQKTDYWANGTPPALGSLPNPLPIYIGAGLPTSSLEFTLRNPAFTGWKITHGTFWLSIGQMFDPLSAADTSWLTSSPSSTIASAKAWVNAQLTNYTSVNVGTDYTYFVTATGQDLYSQADNYVLKQNNITNTDWTNAVSTTNIIRNN